MGYRSDCIEFKKAWVKKDTAFLEQNSAIAYATYVKRFGDWRNEKASKVGIISGDLTAGKKELRALLSELPEPEQSVIDNYSMCVPSGSNMDSRILGWTLKDFMIASDIYGLVTSITPNADVDPAYGIDVLTMSSFMDNLFKHPEYYCTDAERTDYLNDGVPDNKVGEIAYVERRVNKKMLFPDNAALMKILAAAGTTANAITFGTLIAKTGTVAQGKKLAGSLSSRLASKLAGRAGVTVAAGGVEVLSKGATAAAATGAVDTTLAIGTTALATTGETAAVATATGASTAVGSTLATAASGIALPAVIGVAAAVALVPLATSVLEHFHYGKGGKYTQEDIKEYSQLNWGGYRQSDGRFLSQVADVFSELFCSKIATSGNDYKSLVYAFMQGKGVAQDKIEEEIDNILAMVPKSSGQQDRYATAYRFAGVYFS